MRSITLLSAFAGILFLQITSFSIQVLAVTASPYPFEFRQPDGKRVTLRMMGDEKVRWAETMDHYTVIRNQSGAWEYGISNAVGDLVPSGILAHNSNDRDMAELSLLNGILPKLAFSPSQVNLMRSIWNQQQSKAPGSTSGFSPSGTRKLILILIGFTDQAFTKTQTDFGNLMNQVGYNVGNAAGSVKDYYLENSYGQFTMQTTVAGPYTASHPMAYYGANDAYGNDINPAAMVTESVYLANPDVNFADFDNDSNGYLDALYVIFAGYGEEAGASADAIWSHSSGITPVTLDGVVVSQYACSPELRGGSGSTITGIGVICHEFGHVCGAPDYYDVDYANGGQYDGTGSWDMMAGGSWNGDGDVPAHHNAFTKAKIYNWLTASVLNSTQNVILRDIRYNKDVVQFNTTTANEYFLCENRQLTGFNSTNPGHGLIIYHVDGDFIQSTPYAINSGSHQGMYPMSATSLSQNGIMLSGVSNIGTDGCPWPGSGGKTSFTDATTPYSKSWAGNNTAKPITNITENLNARSVTFCFMGCSTSNDPGSLTPTAINSSQINVAWTKNGSGNNVMLVYSATGVFGAPINGTTYLAGNSIAGGGTVLYNGAGTSCNHMGLLPNTSYYYKAFSVLAGNSYSTGIVKLGTTSCGAIAKLPFAEDFNYETFQPECWAIFRGANGLGTGQDWVRNTTFWAYSGGTAFVSYESVSGGLAEDWLVTPAITLPPGGATTLTFVEAQDYGAIDYGSMYYIKVSTTSQSSYASFTNVISYEETSFGATGYTQRSVDLSAYNGQTVYIAFVMVNNDGDSWYVDNVKVDNTNNYWTGNYNTSWESSLNWSKGSPVSSSNLVIPPTISQPIVNSLPASAANCNNLTILSGATLTVNPGKALDVNGTITNLGGLSGIILKSDASGTGSMKANSAVNATVERYITGSATAWHLISSPVSGQNIQSFVTSLPNDIALNSGFTPPKYGLAPYVNTIPGWAHYNTTNVAAAGSFQPGKGYEVLRNSGGVVTFAGTLASGSPTIPVSAGTSAWNLIGNPFSSSFSANQNADPAYNFLTLNSPVFDSPGYVALYVWNPASSSYTIINQATSAAYIPVGQGFFIKSVAGPVNAVFSANGRVHSGQAFLKNSQSSWPAIDLLCQIDDKPCNTQVYFIPGTTTGIDAGYDAGIFNAENTEKAVYTQIGGSDINFGIQSLPGEAIAGSIIPIGLNAQPGAEVTFSGELLNLPDNVIVHLRDILAGTSVRLNTPGITYKVTLNNGSNGTGRFYLMVSKLVDTQKLQEDICSVVPMPAKNILRIVGSFIPGSKVDIYDLSGRILGLYTIDNETINEYYFTAASSGVYLLRIQSGSTVINRKFAWVY